MSLPSASRGNLTIEEVSTLVRSYYKSKTAGTPENDDVQEADITPELR